MEARGERYDRFSARAEMPMLVLSVAFLLLLVVPLVWRTIPAGIEGALTAAEVLIWASFAAEYVVKLALAPDRRRFVRTHVLELVVVALPVLRPLRLVRSVRALRLLRLGRVATVANVAARRSRRALHARVAAYAVALSALLSVVCAALVLEAEQRHPDANITSFGDALWWAFVTVTTVGYGDRYPVTAQGRAVGAMLLVCGIAVLGVLTASLATFFVQHVRGEEQVDEHSARLDRIEVELRKLNERAEGRQ